MIEIKKEKQVYIPCFSLDYQRVGLQNLLILLLVKEEIVFCWVVGPDVFD